jgi:peptidoglycan-N-acetylglucosamine deacetylase
MPPLAASPSAPARRQPGPRERRLRDAVKSAISLASQPFGSIVGVATREPVAALTFDDGPDPEATPLLLEVLERHGAHATFFMVGKAAARHPELLARVAASGHAVANHSWDHPSFPLLTSRGRRCQLRWTAAALGPHEAKLFRHPYGHQTPGSQLDAARLGYRTVAWEAVAEDWRDDPPEALVERVARRLRPGGIALFHDALYTTVEERFRDRGPTIRAVEMLLDRFAGTFRFVTVPELLRLGRARKWPVYKRSDLDWLHRLT